MFSYRVIKMLRIQRKTFITNILCPSTVDRKENNRRKQKKIIKLKIKSHYNNKNIYYSF